MEQTSQQTLEQTEKVITQQVVEYTEGVITQQVVEQIQNDLFSVGITGTVLLIHVNNRTRN